jgi:hypothetical protein
MDAKLKKFSTKFSVENMASLLENRNYQMVSLKFLEIFNAYWDIYRRLDSDELDFLNIFSGAFLDTICRDDFIVPEEHVGTFIRMANHLAKLTALTDLKTTDGHLLRLLGKKPAALENYLERNKIIKILLLYSCLNETELDYQNIFYTFSDIASFWYWAYFEFVNYVSLTALKNLTRHLDQLEVIGPKLNFNFHPPVIAPYLMVSYFNPGPDRKIKQKINSLLQEKYKKVNLGSHRSHNLEKKKIAVISKLIQPGHAVFKGTYEFIRSLSADYDLTMVHLRHLMPVDVENDFAEIFNDIIYLNLSANNLQESLAPLINNDFDLIFYPDIGMSVESIILSNLRLAPVQVTAHGHSVSTFGAEIDYFISGRESENIAMAEKNYSERLVIIPGVGLHSALPDYQVQNLEKFSDEFQIICPWSTQKIHYNHLLNLKKIIERSDKKIVFQTFSSGFESYLSAYAAEIAKILGPDNVRVLFRLNYPNYMALFELGDITLDSFPYGGYNTVIDSLYLGKPVVTLEGEQAYNKFASALLRKIGLGELVALNYDEYTDKTVRLINDDHYRQEIIHRIKEINLYEQIYLTDEPIYFKKAIAHLLENHERLKAENSLQPVIIT